MGAQSKRRWGRSVRVVAAGVVMAALTPQAHALPASLRSDQDVADAVDSVMRSVAAGRVGAGVRLLGSYTSMRPGVLAERIVAIERQHLELRKRLGLGLRTEGLANQHVGKRLWRVTQVQHYDRGFVAWHFIFHKPESGWQLLALDVVENDAGVFDPALRVVPGASAPPIPHAPAEAASPPLPDPSADPWGPAR